MLRIENGMIWNEDNQIIAVLTDEATPEDKRNLVMSEEIVLATENFVEQVNSGKFKPRTIVKTFERILEKYPQIKKINQFYENKN